MKPTVTILLATFNRAHLISQTLESIVAQSYFNWECIIVDDNSSDSTRKIISEFTQRDSRFSYYLKSKTYKNGLPGSRNFGLDIAEQRKAEFVQFFDDDDIMHPEKLTKQMNVFIKNNEIEIVNCKYQGFKGKFDINNHIYIGDMNIDTSNLSEDFLFKKIRIHSIGPIFKFKLFDRIRFDVELNYYAEEEELFLRLFFLKKPKYFALNEFLFFYRHHEKSITGSKENTIHKLGSVIRMYQKLWIFLSENNLLNQKRISFFIKYFLIYSYDQNLLKNIYEHIQKSDQLSFFFKQKVKLILFIHRIYLKLVNKFILQ